MFCTCAVRVPLVHVLSFVARVPLVGEQQVCRFSMAKFARWCSFAYVCLQRLSCQVSPSGVIRSLLCKGFSECSVTQRCHPLLFTKASPNVVSPSEVIRYCLHKGYSESSVTHQVTSLCVLLLSCLSCFLGSFCDPASLFLSRLRSSS